MTENQNPEQKARDQIDALLEQAGWIVQHNKKIDFSCGVGIAIREYLTDIGPADYVLFIDKKAVGVIEAKREDLAQNITSVEQQTEGYAKAKLKWVNSQAPLPFLYESTGVITRFTDSRDPKPRSREIFNFHRPETLQEWLLDDVIVRISNGANVTQYEDKIGYPICRIETIWNQGIDLERVKYVKEKDTDFVEKYSLQYGDILLSHINSDAHLGKTGIFKNQTDVLIHGINILLIRPSKEINADFLNYQFNYIRTNGGFIDIAQRSVNQSSVNQGKLKKLNIHIPPFNEQRRIVAKIEELFSELDQGIDNLKTAQAQLKVYRQTLLKHAFEGKLTAEWRAQNADKLESASALQKRIQHAREQRYQQQLAEWQANGKQGSKPKAPKPITPLTAEELAELPELPEGWIWFKLANLADVSGGLTKNQKRNTLPIRRPFLRVANVYANRLELSDIHEIGISESEIDRVLLVKGIF